MPRQNRPEGFKDIDQFIEALDDTGHPDHPRARAHVLDHGQWWRCEACGRDYLDVSCTTDYVLEDLAVAGLDEDALLRLRLFMAIADVDPSGFDTEFPPHPWTRRCSPCEREVQCGDGDSDQGP